MTISILFNYLQAAWMSIPPGEGNPPGVALKGICRICFLDADVFAVILFAPCIVSLSTTPMGGVIGCVAADWPVVFQQAARGPEQVPG
jgi:hypothetical protein